MSRRGRLDIIEDILSVTSKGTKKTCIMNRANLSFKQTSNYLPFLEKAKLIYVKKDGGNTIIFKTSDKGKEFLKKYEDLKVLVQWLL